MCLFIGSPCNVTWHIFVSLRTSTPRYLRLGPFFNVFLRREDVLRRLDALETPLAILGSLWHVLGNDKVHR